MLQDVAKNNLSFIIYECSSFIFVFHYFLKDVKDLRSLSILNILKIVLPFSPERKAKCCTPSMSRKFWQECIYRSLAVLTLIPYAAAGLRDTKTFYRKYFKNLILSTLWIAKFQFQNIVTLFLIIGRMRNVVVKNSNSSSLVVVE